MHRLVRLLAVPLLFLAGGAAAAPTASLDAHRTEGYPPLLVYFTAQDTVDPEVGADFLPFTRLRFCFDAADPHHGDEPWDTAPKALPRGRFCGGGSFAYVYTEPGTYPATVEACNADGDCDTDTVTITVKDFDEPTQTRCISNTGNFNGCPAGADRASASGDLRADVDNAFAIGFDEVLFRANESFVASNTVTIHDPGCSSRPCQNGRRVGSYGDAGRHDGRFRLTMTPSDVAWYLRADGAASDFDLRDNGDRVVDLDERSGIGGLIYNARTDNTADLTGTVLTTRAYGERTLNFGPGDWVGPFGVFGSEIRRPNCRGGVQTIFWNGQQLALVGNTFDKTSGCGEHNLRLAHARGSFIWNNAILGAGRLKASLTVRSLNSEGFHVHEGMRAWARGQESVSQFIVIADNAITARASQAINVCQSNQGGVNGSACRHVVIENNWLDFNDQRDNSLSYIGLLCTGCGQCVGGANDGDVCGFTGVNGRPASHCSSGGGQCVSQGRNYTVRNNVMDRRDADDEGVNVGTYLMEPGSGIALEDIAIYNNSMLGGNRSAIKFETPTPDNNFVRNNVLWDDGGGGQFIRVGTPERVSDNFSRSQTDAGVSSTLTSNPFAGGNAIRDLDANASLPLPWDQWDLVDARLRGAGFDFSAQSDAAEYNGSDVHGNMRSGGGSDAGAVDMDGVAFRGSGGPPLFFVSMGCSPSSGAAPLDTTCTATPNNQTGSVSFSWDTDGDGFDDGSGSSLSLSGLTTDTTIVVLGVDAGSSTTDTATRTVTIVSAPAPPPIPPPGGGAAVVGFVLWNAQTDTVIDSDFRSGDRISLTDHGSCLAIEVIGNAYLQPSGSPGSVQMALDGSPASCSQPGLSHENSAPFAWELDNGPGSFECATSLTAEGSHTLTATPWDGDNCGASSGTPVSISFEVIPGPLSSAPPPPIGIPGQPFVVLE